ncbi:MAG: cytochrome P460 family protein [Acidobacteriota bacterium]|nr:cytochrome P460 family protein [Acidobacteriota bacterium]
MRTSTVSLSVACLTFATVSSVALSGQSAVNDGPRYENGTHLVRPDDYREWTFLSSGLAMAYNDDQSAGASTRPQLFQNVFVNPSSHRAFMETGRWPDGTTFVLEFRRAATDAEISRTGRFQTDRVMLEAEVKDARFPDGWAFFNFGQDDALAEVAEPLAGAQVARCIECHTEHTAVERTFVQFYPTLLEVARQKGTLKPGF